MIELERWGRQIKVSTDPVQGRVRLDVITLPLAAIESGKLEDSQPKLDSGSAD